MKNAISILANNLNYFRLMCNNFPDDISDYAVVVFTETRIGDKTEELKKILRESKADKFKVIPSDMVIDKFKADIIDNAFVDEYTMGMNILMLWYLLRYSKFEKILLLDDDVIIGNGLGELFATKHSLFMPFRLSAGPSDMDKLSQNGKKLFQEWFDIFGEEFNQENYKSLYIDRYMNSGQRLIVRDDISLEYYQTMLHRFFDSKIFHEFWDNRRSHVSFFFDERFEVFTFNKLYNNGMKPFSFLLVSKFEKITENDLKRISKATIFHNITRSHKDRVYRLLVEKGIING